MDHHSPNQTYRTSRPEANRAAASLTRHTSRAARLAERVARELLYCCDITTSPAEAAHLVRLADHLRAFALSLERVAAVQMEVGHAS